MNGYRRTVVGLDPAEPGNSGSEEALVVVGQGARQPAVRDRAALWAASSTARGPGARARGDYCRRAQSRRRRVARAAALEDGRAWDRRRRPGGLGLRASGREPSCSPSRAGCTSWAIIPSSRRSASRLRARPASASTAGMRSSGRAPSWAATAVPRPPGGTVSRPTGTSAIPRRPRLAFYRWRAKVVREARAQIQSGPTRAACKRSMRKSGGQPRPLRREGGDSPVGPVNRNSWTSRSQTGGA